MGIEQLLTCDSKRESQKINGCGKGPKDPKRTKDPEKLVCTAEGEKIETHLQD